MQACHVGEYMMIIWSLVGVVCVSLGVVRKDTGKLMV